MAVITITQAPFLCDNLSDITTALGGNPIPDPSLAFEKSTNKTFYWQTSIGSWIEIPTGYTPNTVTFTTPTFSSATTATKLSATQDSHVIYEFDGAVTIALLAGQSIRASLKYADDSGMSTNVVTVDSDVTLNSGVLGLNQTNGLKVSGRIPANKYRQVTFTTTGGASAPNAIASGQEVQV